MSRHQLAVLGITAAADSADTHVVVRATTREDRYFPPLLAAQLLLDVRGLVQQNCYSKPASGKKRDTRRWAFAQEIYSNQGRGTEAGHFLEHLILEMLSQADPRARRFLAETSWDFAHEPDVYRLRFCKATVAEVKHALTQGAEILRRRQYHLAISHTLASSTGSINGSSFSNGKRLLGGYCP